MCCCQRAAAVAHLLPVLNSSCLCFEAPKQGQDSGPQKWGHHTKISSPASKFVASILQRAPPAATGCIFHSCFLALGARMLVSQYIYIYVYIIYIYKLINL